MRTLALVALMLPALLSCGGPGDDGSDGGAGLQEQSGSRLRRYWIRAEDGTATVTAPWIFLDTQTGNLCQFVQCEGRTTGAAYCLPQGMTTCPASLQGYVKGSFLTD